MIVHQSIADISFLQGRVNHNASCNVGQFHDGCADHERNVARASERDFRLRVNTARVRDDRPGSSDRNVVTSVGMEERITAEVHGKSTVRIAPEHLFKRDLVGNPRFVVLTRFRIGSSVSVSHMSGQSYAVKPVNQRNSGACEKFSVNS